MKRFINSGLIVAAILFWAAGCGGGEVAKTEDPVLAKVGNEMIRQSDLDRLMAQTPEHLRSIHRDPRTRELFLNQLIQQKLMYLAAKDRGYDRLPEVQARIHEAEEKVLQEEFFQRNFLADEPITDAEIRQYYDKSRQDYLGEEQVRLQHIEVADKGTADKLVQRLSAGADFGGLARKYSLDKLSSENGGDLGYVLRRRSIPGIGGPGKVSDLVEVAFDAETGEIAGPIKIDDHYHIIRVIEAAHRPPVSLDHAKASISQQLVRQRRLEKEKALFGELERKYPVQKLTDALSSGPTKTARELFEEAQTAVDPKERIAAYQRIVELYPDRPDAEKALFMTGYTYSNDLKDYEQAEEVFRRLLEKYPSGEFVDDTRWMLKNMRLSERKLNNAIGGRNP